MIMHPSISVVLLPVIALVLSTAPATTQPATTPATPSAPIPEIDSLRERALRDLHLFAEYTGTRFIALGYADNGDPVDPMPEFLARFDDLKPRIQPVSKVKRIGKRRDEQGRSLLWHYEDPETGKRARVYRALILERRADATVLVDVGFSSGSLSGGGRVVIYRFVEGQWKLEQIVHSWVS